MKMIGVVPLYDEERDSYWLVPGYMKMLEKNGAVPLMLPLTDNCAELDTFLDICGGFIFTGGQDVSPEFYGETPKEACGKPCPLRDKMEKYLLEEAVKRDRSVLGICRGIQFMNAIYGGTLYQDLPTEYKGNTDHCMKPPYDRIAHYVDIIPDTPLYDILKQERIGVNSYHHQAIKALAPQLKMAAVSEDGLTEAVYLPNARFVLAVQWHPEFSYETDGNSSILIKAFADSVKEV